MARSPSSPWINVVAAVVGGVVMGFGLARMLGGFPIYGGIVALAGMILLWWTFIDRRKAESGTPESERDGSHTIE
jgi:hypothetical protein